MTTGFARLQRELTSAERRLSDADLPPARARRRVGVPIAALTVTVALVIAGGAVVLIGSHAHPGPAAPTRPSVRSSVAAGTSPASIAALVALLGVLRRPQTAADRSSPLLRAGSQTGLTLDRREARRATTTRAGRGVFVIPARETQAGQAPVARVVLEAGGAFEPFSLQDLESGRASFSVGLTGGRQDAFVLVPDGVARVAYLTSGSSSRIHLSAVVHGNVAILYASPTADSPADMRWYSATGAAIPIHDHLDPPVRYPVNASGQTYGSEAGQPGGRLRPGEEPDLISVIGRSIHGSRHVTGYVRRAPLNAAQCGDVKTPKQALQCDARAGRRPRTIPVYAQNGKTVIGYFTLG